MQLKSLYMPDSIIQNDEFPAHVTWNKNDNLEITVILPETIEIKEVYNVPSEYIENLESSSAKFDEFEVNGYLGFVFKTRLLNESKSIEDVEFIIKDLDTSKTKRFVKQIQLFRPAIELIKTPSNIVIKHDSEDNLIIDEKIHLKNYGNGTALISVKIDSEDGFNMAVPHEIDDFNTKVLHTFETELEGLKSDYPEHSSLLDDFYSLLKEPISLDKDTKAKIESIESNFVSIFEENEKFHEGFSLCIWNAYIKNVQLVTKIESFMSYLNSVGKNKILLLNSIELLKCEKMEGNIKLLIEITDLNYNDYPTIEIPSIAINCEKECKVPIYSLFEWNGESGAGE
ncbi:hypothetical protein [Methanococcoides sp. AM1]|uniref:hypothetical protein n=1 Tax=Methanococcoides sp. AM1 TaxID=1201011 RepID=UPI001083BB68|nr:hypothetical protein [Methanococcoides sp. AM1]